MHNVAKEMFQHQSFNHPASAQTAFMNNNQESAAYPGFSYYPNSIKEKSKGRTQVFMEQSQRIASIEEIVNGSKKVTPEIVMKQMSERYVCRLSKMCMYRLSVEIIKILMLILFSNSYKNRFQMTELVL